MMSMISDSYVLKYSGIDNESAVSKYNLELGLSNRLGFKSDEAFRKNIFKVWEPDFLIAFRSGFSWD
jgi:hypothetical protein